jgi:hypothetical protein
MFMACSASLAGTAVSTLSESSFSAGMERVLTGAAGDYQAEFVALMRQISRGSIGTRKIDVLSAPALGVSNIIFRQVTQGGTGNDTYKSLAGGATSMVVPRRLSWSAGAPAVLSVEIIFLSANGTTAPVTVGTTAGDLTSEAGVWVGSGTGISAIEVDFGYDIQIPPDGHLYPIQAFIASQRPVISITTNDESLITTANVNPGSVATTLTAAFAAVASGGVRGTTRSYAVTGHYHVDSVAPGTVRVTCAAKDGITVS